MEEAGANENPEIGDFLLADRVTDHHLIEEMTTDSWLMRWGLLTDSIGYIQVKAMWLYADLDIAAERREALSYVGAYVEAFNQLYLGECIERERRGPAAIFSERAGGFGGG